MTKQKQQTETKKPGFLPIQYGEEQEVVYHWYTKYILDDGCKDLNDVIKCLEQSVKELKELKKYGCEVDEIQDGHCFLRVRSKSIGIIRNLLEHGWEGSEVENGEEE